MTSEETYNERRKQISEQIITLKSQLIQKDKQFKLDTKDWGYAGDLERISNLLSEITDNMHD